MSRATTRTDRAALRAALERVRDLLAAEAWDRTRRLSQAVDLLGALIEDGPQAAGGRRRARRDRR